MRLFVTGASGHIGSAVVPISSPPATPSSASRGPTRPPLP